ncbi:Kinase, CAMK CAMKL [Giardia muris]|uniref:Kinase, CAMK CAMKL n=1 Tax=Giardia muris TaxID=5742 RepID=A0A4Z1SY92_GIAMU|nr:Kinase, CAMK CAMKL [Giardia muris]|eukprot:TNJ26643.1 Kinase, CAMK CAMKL [Giardia muris]
MTTAGTPEGPDGEPGRIGNYVLGKTLGTGTFGKVRLGVHERTGLTVAVKIMSRVKINQMGMWAKVEREIRIMQMARHPHIIALYEVIETPEEIYLVMECAEGGELFSYIVQHKRLDVDTARRFFQQIISALNYLHVKVSVTHRDLKPENILLMKHGVIKLSDFGLSNVMSEGEFLKTSCGSPNYASPEVVAGDQYIGPAADVWSAGCVLYTLLVGRLPFDDHFMPSLFRKIKSGEYTLPDFIDQGAAEILRGMMTVDVRRRFTIDAIRAHPWFQCNLPAYLKVSIGSDFGELEEEVRTSTPQGQRITVDYLELGLPESIEDVRRLIRNGETTDAVVCYKLLLNDAIEKVIAGFFGETKASDGQGSSELSCTLASLNGDAGQKSSHEFSGMTFNTYLSAGAEAPGKLDKRSLFYFGVAGCNIAVQPPADMMVLILRTMLDLGFKWRIGGIRAAKYYDSTVGRETVQLKQDNSKKRNNFCVAFKLLEPQTPLQADLIIGLTLYIAVDHSNCANYVIDLRKVTGELNLFLHYAQLIGQAITERIREA